MLRSYVLLTKFKIFREISFFRYFYYELLAPFSVIVLPYYLTVICYFLLQVRMNLFCKHGYKELCLALDIKIWYWTQKTGVFWKIWKIWPNLRALEMQHFWRDSIPMATILLKQNPQLFFLYSLGIYFPKISLHKENVTRYRKYFNLKSLG